MKVIAYICFFIAGLIVAKFQWHIAFDEDRSGLVQYYFMAIVFVPLVSIAGFVFSYEFLKNDRLLRLIVVMTIALGILQFLAEITNSMITVLNYYARFYAATAILLPLISYVRNILKQRNNLNKGY